jgi:hypothetical protein
MNDGTWHAWCFSWSDAGKIQVFKDGATQQGSKSDVASGTKLRKGNKTGHNSLFKKLF